MLFNVTCTIQGPATVPAKNNPFEAQSLSELLRVINLPEGPEIIGINIELVGSEPPDSFHEDDAPNEFHRATGSVVVYRGVAYRFSDRRWWRQ